MIFLSCGDYYLWLTHYKAVSFLQLWLQSHVSIDWDHFQRWNGRLQLSVHDQRVWNPSFTEQFHPTRCVWTEWSHSFSSDPEFRFRLCGHTPVLMDGRVLFPQTQRGCCWTVYLEAEVMISPAFHLFLHPSLSGGLRRVDFQPLLLFFGLFGVISNTCSINVAVFLA